MSTQTTGVRAGAYALAVFFWMTLSTLPVRVAETRSGFNHPTRDVQQPAPSSAGEYDRLEAVLETTMGQMVIEFFPKDAPRHVEYFVKQARAGIYDETAFHLVVQNGLIQGGDPTTKNPRVRTRYGSGGLKAGLPDEINRNKHIAGAVSAALSLNPSNPNEVIPGSSGSQFFIIIGPQPKLDSKYTVFGRVVEGMEVAARISNIPAAKPSGLATQRVEITKMTIRERTPTVEQMKARQVIIETSLGNIKLQLMPEVAPDTTRAFVRYARSGLYDGTSFFRVSGGYFLEGGNLADWAPESPNRKRFFSLWPIPVEKNDVKQVRGTVSIRQSQDGTTSCYYFIISQDNSALDGKHVPIAKVAEGLEVVDKIAQTEVGEGDKPKQRIEVKKITIQ